jgi:putative SOS response-associated peptidase YedK
MCFHYSLVKERTEIALQLDVDWDDDSVWQPTWHANGFAFPAMPVITQAEPKKIKLYHWGLIPFWIKTEADAGKIKMQTLNARSETVYEKPSFKHSIPNKRCLVIADGFFEWMEYGKNKYPHYIFLKAHPVFCFAGIYNSWVDKASGEIINTFSILTTAANPMMARIHITKKRMPVILHKTDYKKWLEPDLPADSVQELLRPFPDSDMDFYTISKRITSRSENPNVPEVLDPFIYPELALL